MAFENSGGSSHVEISLVVPYFNPGKHFMDHISAVVLLLRHSGLVFELIAVNDGSTDGSFEALSDFREPEIVMLNHKTNQGKGESLRNGFRHANGAWIGFIDADGDLPAYQLQRYLDVVTKQTGDNPDMILASKMLEESHVQASLIRKMSSYFYHFLVKMLFKVKVRDTQTGLKFFKREVVEKVLENTVETGFVFDLEFIVLAIGEGYSNILELPAVISKRHSSTISLKSVFSIFSDTLSLKMRLRNNSHSKH
ncbi:MAG: glycosyltransferase family 2 protein [Acidimicrobiales bacterium]|nr:glycosyltransferase family 2 protein [Acidimicrobiales bacterium]